MTHLDSIARVLPVILIIALGAGLRWVRLFTSNTSAEIKQLVVNVTLPALLFLAFAHLDAERRYLGLVATMFLACTAGLLIGKVIQPWTNVRARTFPVLFTGFEAGMMGYALYASIYGQENLHRFALVDLGHVIFVFTVLIPVLNRSFRSVRPLRETLVGIARTPVILAIVAGLLTGGTGLLGLLTANPLTSGVLDAVQLVGAMTTPLVAILIGHDLRLSPRGLSRPGLTLALRLLVWIPAGLLIASLVVRRWLGLDRGYVAALMMLVVLPPPFVIPIFLPKDDRAELEFAVDVLALGALMTLVMVAMLAFFFPV
jgi:malate permease and related proteins